MKRLPRIVLVPAMALLLALIPQVSAIADPDASCSSEDGIFWSVVWFDGSHYHYRLFDYGNYGEIKISDRDLNVNCGNLTNLAGSTTHMRKDPLSADLVEVGYDEGWDSIYVGHVFRWFYEVVISGTPIRHQGSWGSWPCTFPGVGNFMGFRATQIIGGSTWNLKVNCLDGSGDHNVGSNVAASFSGGVATAETYRFGGSNTGMSDDHRNMDYRPGDYSTWTNWTGGLCLQDNPGNNWNGYMYSSTEYRTVKNSTNNCPTPP